MAKRLVERKVKEASHLLAEAERVASPSGKKPLRIGDFVRYQAYIEGRGRLRGVGQIELMNPGAPCPLFIHELQDWVMLNEVAGLPKDRWKVSGPVVVN